MPITISFPDTLRQSVEATSGGKNTVLYDNKGYPSIMCVIPKFNLEDIDVSFGTGVHPAFMVNGVQKSEIFIGKFQSFVHDNLALSLPNQEPKVNITFNQAKDYSTSKGSGWHLMNVFEWSAITMWCMKNTFQPRGNTQYGKSNEAQYETGRRIDKKAPGDSSGNLITITGSGPMSWYHDNTPFGISDLVGNASEWTDLFKTNNGQIICTSDNHFDLKEENWTTRNIYFDSTQPEGSNGEIVLTDSITNSITTYINKSWKNTVNTTSNPNLLLMKQLLIAPSLTSSGQLFENAKGEIIIVNSGERYMTKGGHSANATAAGLFYNNIRNEKTQVAGNISSRLAFIQS